MNMEEITNEIQRHLDAAYALLPPTLEPLYPHDNGEELKTKYHTKQWRQVFLYIRNYSRKNDFSTELLHHLKEAGELFDLSDSLGMRTALEQLTDEEKSIIGQCLCATAFGPFFPDYIFSALLGVERDEAIRIAKAWPNVEETDISAGLVINASINNLFGYPHRKENEWANYISVSHKQVYDTYNKFRALTGKPDNQQTGKAEYFHNVCE